MLVKFMSFVASILGTARYKTILLSSFAVVLSLTGVTAMAIFRDSHVASESAASTIDKTADDAKTKSTSPQLGDTSKQSTKKEITAQTPNSTSTVSNAPTNSSDSQSAATPQAPNEPSMSVTIPAELTITAGDNSDSRNNIVTLNTPDQSPVTWSAVITGVNDKGPVRIINATANTAATFSFQIQADRNQSGKTIQVTVSARDTSRNINISKQITVTIQ